MDSQPSNKWECGIHDEYEERGSNPVLAVERLYSVLGVLGVVIIIMVVVSESLQQGVLWLIGAYFSHRRPVNYLWNMELEFMQTLSIKHFCNDSMLN